MPLLLYGYDCISDILIVIFFVVYRSAGVSYGELLMSIMFLITIRSTMKKLPGLISELLANCNCYFVRFVQIIFLY